MNTMPTSTMGLFIVNYVESYIISFLFSRIDTPILIESKHTSILTTDAQIYIQFTRLKYYGIMQMNVSKDGKYDFLINSTVEVDVSLYNNYFDPNNDTENLLLSFYLGCNSDQTKFTRNLRSDEKYYLLITASDLNATSSFSIVLIGPSQVLFNEMCECFCLMRIKPYAENLFLDCLYLDKPKLVQSVYSSSWTQKSQKCSYQGCDLDSFCELIKIHVTETGYYIFTVSTNEGFFGYFRENDFSIFDVSINANITLKGWINVKKASLHLQMSTSLTLILMSKPWFRQGAFSINVQGQSKVIMKHIGMSS